MSSVWSKIQVVILTLNEERKIAATLSSIPDGTSVLVVDSGSVDGTICIIQESSSRLRIQVAEHQFNNYAEQRNYALSMVSHPWVLMLDSDERLSSELVEEISVQLPGDDADPFLVLAFPWQNYLGDVPIFTGNDTHVRLFRSNYFTYKGIVHEKLFPKPSGIIYTRGVVHHYTYDSTKVFADKVVRYSYLEAKSRHGSLQLRDYMRPLSTLIYFGLVKGGLFRSHARRVHAILMTFYHCLVILFFIELRSSVRHRESRGPKTKRDET